MSADPHVRAATEQMILRERLELLKLFPMRVAAVQARYYADTLERGMPSAETRQALADLLAPYGLADPDGQGRHPTLAKLPDVGKFDPVADEYRRADLRSHGVGLDVFRSEVARRNRESPRPVTPAEVADALVREAVPRRASAPLRLAGQAAQGIRRLARHGR